MRALLSLFAALLLAIPAERKQGNPLDHLPANFEILTHFGERADISPDNLRVAFMAKSFGDAMVIDLKTREMRSEEHTSELQSRFDLVCRLLLEKKNDQPPRNTQHSLCQRSRWRTAAR